MHSLLVALRLSFSCCFLSFWKSDALSSKPKTRSHFNRISFVSIVRKHKSNSVQLMIAPCNRSMLYRFLWNLLSLQWEKDVYDLTSSNWINSPDLITVYFFDLSLLDCFHASAFTTTQSNLLISLYFRLCFRFETCAINGISMLALLHIYAVTQRQFGFQSVQCYCLFCRCASSERRQEGYCFINNEHVSRIYLVLILWETSTATNLNTAILHRFFVLTERNELSFPLLFSFAIYGCDLIRSEQHLCSVQMFFAYILSFAQLWCCEQK